MFLLAAMTIGTKIASRASRPFSDATKASPDFHTHEIGLLYAGGDDITLLKQIDEFRNAVEGGASRSRRCRRDGLALMARRACGKSSARQSG